MKRFFLILDLNLPSTSWDCSFASYQLSPKKREQNFLAATFLQVAVGIDVVFIQLFVQTKQPLFLQLFSHPFTSFITLLWLQSGNSTLFLYLGAQNKQCLRCRLTSAEYRQSLPQILCCWAAFQPYFTCPYLWMRFWFWWALKIFNTDMKWNTLNNQKEQ